MRRESPLLMDAVDDCQIWCCCCCRPHRRCPSVGRWVGLLLFRGMSWQNHIVRPHRDRQLSLVYSAPTKPNCAVKLAATPAVRPPSPFSISLEMKTDAAVITLHVRFYNRLQSACGLWKCNGNVHIYTEIIGNKRNTGLETTELDGTAGKWRHTRHHYKLKHDFFCFSSAKNRKTNMMMIEWRNIRLQI